MRHNDLPPGVSIFDEHINPDPKHEALYDLTEAVKDWYAARKARAVAHMALSEAKAVWQIAIARALKAGATEKEIGEAERAGQ